MRQQIKVSLVHGQQLTAPTCTTTEYIPMVDPKTQKQFKIFRLVSSHCFTTKFFPLPFHTINKIALKNSSALCQKTILHEHDQILAFRYSPNRFHCSHSDTYLPARNPEPHRTWIEIAVYVCSNMWDEALNQVVPMPKCGRSGCQTEDNCFTLDDFVGIC